MAPYMANMQLFCMVIGIASCTPCKKYWDWVQTEGTTGTSVEFYPNELRVLVSVISIPNNIPARTYDHGSRPQPDRTWPYTAIITPPFQSVLSNHWELCVHTSPKWDSWTIHWSTISKIHIRIWIWIRRRILHKILIKSEVTFFAESQLQHHVAPYFRLVSDKCMLPAHSPPPNCP